MRVLDGLDPEAFSGHSLRSGLATSAAEGGSTEPVRTLAEVDAALKRQLPFVYKGVIPDKYRMGTEQLAKVIDYGVKLVGEDHIALGSDFDGGPPLPREIHDISDYPEMTKAMERLGYSE